MKIARDATYRPLFYVSPLRLAVKKRSSHAHEVDFLGRRDTLLALSIVHARQIECHITAILSQYQKKESVSFRCYLLACTRKLYGLTPSQSSLTTVTFVLYAFTSCKLRFISIKASLTRFTFLMILSNSKACLSSCGFSILFCTSYPLPPPPFVRSLKIVESERKARNCYFSLLLILRPFFSILVLARETREWKTRLKIYRESCQKGAQVSRTWWG